MTCRAATLPMTPADAGLVRPGRVRAARSGALELVADLTQQQDLFHRGGRRGRRRFAFEAIDLLDHDEDREREDDEVEQDGEEITVSEHRHAGLLERIERG